MRRARIHVRPNISKLASVPRNRKSEAGSTTEPAKPALATEENEIGVKLELSNNAEKIHNVQKILSTEQRVEELQTVFLENIENLETVTLDDTIKLEEFAVNSNPDVEIISSENAADGEIIVPEFPKESASGADKLSESLDRTVELDSSNKKSVVDAAVITLDADNSEVEAVCETDPHRDKTLSLEDYLRDTASDPDIIPMRTDDAIDESVSSLRMTNPEATLLLSAPNEDPGLRNELDNDDDDLLEPLSPTKSAKNRSPVKGKKEVFPRRRYNKGKEPPDREKMTMSDLIYWNPTDNPMKCAPKSNRPQVDFVPVHHDTDSNSDSQEVPEAQEASLPVPKLIVGPNGEVTIDEESLYIKQSVPEISSVVYEASPTTYSSFREKRTTLKWSKSDTILFYRALSSIGTDFTMMSGLLKKWKRYDLKQKYKHEWKRNPEFVQNIVRKADCLNMQLLEKTIAEEIVNDEFGKEVLENQKNSRKKGTLKQKDAQGSKIQEPLSVNQQNDETLQTMDGNAENPNIQVEDKICVPVKKKRGRKPKVQAENSILPDLGNGVALESKPEKKKRGRKPKMPKEANTSLDAEGSSDSRPKCQQPISPTETGEGEESKNSIIDIGMQHDDRPNERTDASAKSVLPEGGETIKKKRGRKPKPKIEDPNNSIEGESATEPVKRKRSRKPKPKDDTVEGSAGESGKKKRGRPPKVLEEIETDMESSEDEEDESGSEMTKSYPKREKRMSALAAKLHYNEESDEDIEDGIEMDEEELTAEGNVGEGSGTATNLPESTEPIKKRRGRKPKPKPEQNNDGEEELVAPPLKKKRGRKPKVRNETDSIILENIELIEVNASINEDENEILILSDTDKGMEQEGGNDETEEQFVTAETTTTDLLVQDITLGDDAENVVLLSETGEVIPYQVIPYEEPPIIMSEDGSQQSVGAVEHNVLLTIDSNVSQECLQNKDSKRQLRPPKVKFEPKTNSSPEHLRTGKKKVQVHCKVSRSPVKNRDDNNSSHSKESRVVRRLNFRNGMRTTSDCKTVNEVCEGSSQDVPKSGVNLGEVSVVEDLSVTEIGSYVTVETEPRYKRKRKKDFDETIHADSGKRTPKYSDFTIEEFDSSDKLEDESVASASGYDSNVLIPSLHVHECHQGSIDSTTSPVTLQIEPNEQVPEPPDTSSHKIILRNRTSIDQNETSAEADNMSVEAIHTNEPENRLESEISTSDTELPAAVASSTESETGVPVICCTPEHSDANCEDMSFAVNSVSSESHLMSAIQMAQTPEDQRKHLHTATSTVINEAIRLPITPTSEKYERKKNSQLSIPSPSIARFPKLRNTAPKFTQIFRTPTHPPFSSPAIPTATVKVEKNIPSAPVMFFASSPDQRSIVHIFALNSPPRNQSTFLPEIMPEGNDSVNSEGAGNPRGLIHEIIKSFNPSKTPIKVHDN